MEQQNEQHRAVEGQRFNVVIRVTLFLLLTILLSFALPVEAKDKLHATGGATTVEGSAGGGIVPWAVIHGYGDDGQWGITSSATIVDSNDYSLHSASVAIGVSNRYEISIARQRFDLGTLSDQTGLPRHIAQDIYGLKVKLVGDLIFSRLPQIALGVQYKANRDFFVPGAVGAKENRDTEVYVSATKLWLGGLFARNLLSNLTLRSTKANQLGLLGFGGDKSNSQAIVAEASVALLLNRYWAVGVEYREKPNNLSFAEEEDWQDIFVAWFPSKHLSVVAAYADLGSIAGFDNQNAWYISLQGSF